MKSKMYTVLLLQVFIASATHIVAKVVVKDIEPLALTLMRSVIAAASLGIIAALQRRKLAIARSDYRAIAILSFLAIPVNQFLFLKGIQYSTPANAALLYATTPAAVLLVSFLMGRERMTWRKGLGVGVAFAGILMVLFERGINFGSGYMFGNALLLIAVVAWTLYTVLGKPMIVRYGAFSTTAVTMIVGALMFIPIGFMNFINLDVGILSPTDWGGLLYLALGTSVLAYGLWYYALARTEASRVAIFSNLQPILTTILAVVLLGQTVTLTFVVGGLVTLSGVIITQFG